MMVLLFLRRVHDVDMKRDFAFVDFSDSRDADDARYSLNGRDVDGSRIVVEFVKGAPRGGGGGRDRDGGGGGGGSREFTSPLFSQQFPVNSMRSISVANSGKRATIRFFELKRRRYLYPLMVGIGLLLLQQLTGINGVLFYSSDIFESAGIQSSKAATFGLGAIQVVATAVTTGLVDKSGRIVLLMVINR
ncbi:hypothetical protein LXL04_036032 [Taraxacum kok-saghyz]